MVEFEPDQHVLCIDAQGVDDLIEEGKVYTIKRVQVSTKLMFKNEQIDEDVCLVLYEVSNWSYYKNCEIGFNHRRFKPLPKLKIENFVKVLEHA